MIVKPPDIIHHIVGEELEKGHDVIDTTETNGLTGLGRARDNHEGWEMAFSVHKKINSKKLVENIAKESRLFPFFKGDKLSFNSLKDVYESGDADFQIKDSDVISYKFDRTKIEDIKTKVILLYHYDYATDEFVKSTESLGIEQTASDYFEDAGSGYDNSYYGIEGEQGDDPIEVKYIRHQGTPSPYEETIVKLQQFLLAWYCNQHNTCKVKLFLSYLFAEVGDITTFPTLLNGRKAYGEDYSLEYRQNNPPVIRNGQEILPYWMVMGVSKSLDSVTLDLIQLHNLTTNLTNVAPIAVISAPTSIPELTLVTLDGSNSFDPEGGGLDYYWDISDNIVLDLQDPEKPTFTAPAQSTPEGATYPVSLQVTDPEGNPSNVVNHSIRVTDIDYGYPEGTLINYDGDCGIFLSSPDGSLDPIDDFLIYLWEHGDYWYVSLGYGDSPDSGSFSMQIITNHNWRLELNLGQGASESYDELTVSYDGVTYGGTGANNIIPVSPESVPIQRTSSGGDTIIFNMTQAAEVSRLFGRLYNADTGLNLYGHEARRIFQLFAREPDQPSI